MKTLFTAVRVGRREGKGRARAWIRCRGGGEEADNPGPQTTHLGGSKWRDQVEVKGGRGWGVGAGELAHLLVSLMRIWG